MAQTKKPITTELVGCPGNGDVILSHKPADWDDFFAALEDAEVPADFLDEKERNQGTQERAVSA